MEQLLYTRQQLQKIVSLLLFILKAQNLQQIATYPKDQMKCKNEFYSSSNAQWKYIPPKNYVKKTQLQPLPDSLKVKALMICQLTFSPHSQFVDHAASDAAQYTRSEAIQQQNKH